MEKSDIAKMGILEFLSFDYVRQLLVGWLVGDGEPQLNF